MCYADDLGHCSEVQQLTSTVDRLMFYEAARRLVVITRSLLMTQLQVALGVVAVVGAVGGALLCGGSWDGQHKSLKALPKQNS